MKLSIMTWVYYTVTRTFFFCAKKKLLKNLFLSIDDQMKHRQFKSPDKRYQRGHFQTAARPRSPSPKRKDYAKVAVVKPDGVSRCAYIHPDTNRRCRMKLGMYPEFCYIHTMLIHNLYISRSSIPNSGNGLYAGPVGFKRGDIIGEYSTPFNAATQGQIEKRCGDTDCWSYVFCDDPKRGQAEEDAQCWDGLDARSTLIRNINDARGSGRRNNAYFDVIRGRVFAIASRNIRPNTEIFINYGSHYWK